MDINEWLREAQARLSKAGVASNRLDALVLLEDYTGKKRSWLLANSAKKIDKPIIGQLTKAIEQRSHHVPLAYIRGKSEFFGREFLVSANTLQPRPETETMIELLLKMANEKWQMKNIIDVGTGSGCIAITAKLELPDANVYATDVSEACLKIAQRNASKLDAEITFYKGNLLDPLLSTNYQLPTIVLANLPYVPDDHTINEAAMHEPKLAIFGGKDGLDYYRQLFAQIDKSKLSTKLLLTESLPPQHSALRLLAEDFGFKHKMSQDFIQVFEKV